MGLKNGHVLSQVLQAVAGSVLVNEAREPSEFARLNGARAGLAVRDPLPPSPVFATDRVSVHHMASWHGVDGEVVRLAVTTFVHGTSDGVEFENGLTQVVLRWGVPARSAAHELACPGGSQL
jgi:hypothetical protein